MKLAAVCEKCQGTGLLYWGRSQTRHCDWYVPCPQCRPNEEQKHPDYETVRFEESDRTPEGK